ncbi:MAG TPA: DUF262 domain-containing protein [Candidatus Dormibacteraeota bacterium]|nr:DUF262 domain-containing protein [Candidatus Dormibacteraeota bacterium]
MADAPDEQVVQLLNAIDSKLAKVHTQSLDLSFNELLDMRRAGELDINPDYQRLFQWSEGARSRFIESLLLEMPVPPIYVIEQDEGRYLLIDGLQRISSYLHLRGQLEALHLDPPVHDGEKLVLTDCDIVDELNGKTFDDLGTALQIRLKRAFVRVEVVRKGSDPRFKYHMFKRLNTGGQLLTPQQIRNCTIRLLDPAFNDFIVELSHTESFTRTTDAMSLDASLGAFDQELVLRFFAMKNYRQAFKHDVGDFLTEYMERVSDQENRLPFDFVAERAIFERTFSVLDRALLDRAFAYANKARDQLTRGFSVYHYEAITLGVQSRLAALDPADDDLMRTLREVLRDIKLDPAFIKLTTGGGKNSPGQLKERIAFVQAKVEARL